ncbi:hypothetical protein MVEN_01333700 [Mycena venus]|uniref:F-box domain-containing protein n=1 Tax=Mycena venus TaxID=2733690 RepID=A0A8H6Y072_9AGAR|nr:hypothetical protein MVEN_01333700 [Mycena venus]
MPAGLLLSDLAPDVIFSIFACCDISSVVSTAQTCRYLHRLAFDISVWLVLLDNLRRRSILDRTCTPDIKVLSTDEIIDIVKRLITGPKTWTTPLDAADPVAEVTREIEVHPKIRVGGGILHWENMAKLLPSGRYVLFNNWRALECWNVADDRLVWKHASAIEHASVLEFAADEVEDSVVILICVRSYPRNYDDRKNYLEVVDVDLQTGAHNSLLITRAPDSDYDNPFCWPVIRGALAAVGTNSQSNTYMIVNWRTQSHLTLKCNPHIVLKTSLDGEDQVHLISNDALLAYWAPTLSIDDPGPAEFAVILVEAIPKLGTFVDPDADQSFSYMSVIESPIQHGSYRIWIHGTLHTTDADTDTDASNTTTGGLLCYQLSILIGGSGDVKPQWRKQRRATGAGMSLYHTIPYSGHGLFYTNPAGYRMFSPTASESEYGSPQCQPRVEFRGSGDHVDVGLYSGTITYSTSNSIVIRYYR